MDVNQKMLMELAEQLGLEERSKTAVSKASNVARGYANKSDEELLREIKNLKSEMKSNPNAYKKQISAIYALRAMMNKDQQERLDKVIALLEED